MPGLNFAFALLRPRRTIVPELLGTADGYLDEEHTIAVDSTAYPVEEGAALTDHAFKQPDSIVLTGHVSNLITPELSLIPRGIEKPPLIWNIVLALAKARKPLILITTLGFYQNMLLVNATTRVDDQVGLQALIFKLTFREILFRPVIEADGVDPTEDGPLSDRVGLTNSGSVLAETTLPSQYLAQVLP